MLYSLFYPYITMSLLKYICRAESFLQEENQFYKDSLVYLLSSYRKKGAVP